MPYPAAYKARAKERRSGFQRPGAANDNRPGGVGRPANDNRKPVSIPLGRPAKGVPMPMPMRAPIGGAGGFALQVATDMYIQALQGYQVGYWRHYRHCATGPRTGFLGTFPDAHKQCITTPQFYTPIWEGQATTRPVLISMRNTSAVPDTYRGYALDTFIKVDGAPSSVAAPELANAGQAATPLPEAFPVQNPARPPKPRCGGQPSAKPALKTLPQNNPDIPPVVDPVSAAKAGFKPSSARLKFTRGGKPKFGKMAGPRGKPKRPGGRPEPPKSKLGKGGKALWWLAGSASEGIDILQAAHDALPDYAKSDPDDPVPTVPEMIDDLWHGSDKIDTGKMMENIINNQIEDFVYSGLGQAGKKANQLTGSATGGDRALGASMKDESSDFDLPTVDIDWANCKVSLIF